MIYRVESLNEKFIQTLKTRSPEEWLFGWLSFMLLEVPRFEITGYHLSEAIANNLQQAGMGLTLQGEAALLEKAPAVSTAIETNFSVMPLAAIPFSIVCAARGKKADIRGLHGLMNFQGIDVISLLQRELFRFGAHTDFCDRSKLKVFDDQPIHKKIGPVDVSKSNLLTLFFIPLVLRLGPMEMEIDKQVIEEYGAFIAMLGFEMTAP